MKSKRGREMPAVLFALMTVQCKAYCINPTILKSSSIHSSSRYFGVIHGRGNCLKPIGFNTQSSLRFNSVGPSDSNDEMGSNTEKNTNPPTPADDENKDEGKAEVPSIKRIIKFSISAIGVYLCSPLLSMIDTSTVGLFAGTLQQAALNPAISITDYSTQAMVFLYVATTNMIATSQQKKTAEELKDSLIGALRFSFIFGAGIAALLLLTSQRALVPLVGNDTIDPELLRAAWRYVAIRALGMPAAAMIGTSQSACLGLQDNKTPFQIIVTAAVLNLVLDVALVGRKIPWVGGTAGAAWATTASQYLALSLFLRKFASKPEEKSNEKLGGNGNIRKKPSTKGLLAGKLRWNNFFALPCKNTWAEFKPYVLPVSTTQIGRMSTYLAMGHVVSSTLNTASLAAQQILTTIFFTLIPIGDSCGLTAQSFIPSIAAQEPSQARNDALRKTMANISKVAGLQSVCLSLIALSLPFIYPLLTSDQAVLSIVCDLVPMMFVLLSTHPFFCTSEGLLLGFRDLKFLGRIYTVFFVTIPMLMLRLKYVAKAGGLVKLASVWNIFIWYQAFRIFSFSSRLFMVILRSKSEAGETEMAYDVIPQ